MPNWCITDIVITHCEEDKLKEFADKIKDYTSRNYMDNEFGTRWLGNLVIGADIGTVDTNKDTDIECRGSMTYMELEGNRLDIQTETAWVPMMKCWVKLVNKYLEGAEITYSAEEPGCALCWTNDASYIGKYRVDNWEDLCETMPSGDYDKEEVIMHLQKTIKTTEQDIGELINMLYESEYGNGISVNEWRYVNVNEID